MPRGSCVADLDQTKHHQMQVKCFGNQDILQLENDQRKRVQWWQQDGLCLPKIFYQEIRQLVMVKFCWAGSDQGYFVATSGEQLEEELAKHQLDLSKVLIQECILEYPVHIHYFSPILNRLEILGLDGCYETNVDGLGCLSYQTSHYYSPHFLL